MSSAQYEHFHQKLVRAQQDASLEADGLLDPDQLTESAHQKWVVERFGEFRPGEFTPLERAMIRAE